MAIYIERVEFSFFDSILFDDINLVLSAYGVSVESMCEIFGVD